MQNRVHIVFAFALVAGCLEAPQPPVGESQSALCPEPPDCPPCYVNSGAGGCFCVALRCTTSLPHEQSFCQNDSCVAQCLAGYGDCDGIASNGCEAAFASDVNNCGSCGHQCPTGPGVGATCTNGICGTICDGVTTKACNGVCIPVAACCTASDCGAVSGASAACVSNTCYYACGSGAAPVCN